MLIFGQGCSISLNEYIMYYISQYFETYSEFFFLIFSTDTKVLCAFIIIIIKKKKKKKKKKSAKSHELQKQDH